MKAKAILLFTVFALAAAASSTLADAVPQHDLKSKAKITQKEAEKTALAKVPGGSIKDAELEKEHGKLIWSFDISTPDSKNITEVQVDAKSGAIVSTEIETPKDQAKEAAKDKKAAKKKH